MQAQDVQEQEVQEQEVQEQAPATPEQAPEAEPKPTAIRNMGEIMARLTDPRELAGCELFTTMIARTGVARLCEANGYDLVFGFDEEQDYFDCAVRHEATGETVAGLRVTVASDNPPDGDAGGEVSFELPCGPSDPWAVLILSKVAMVLRFYATGDMGDLALLLVTRS